MDLNLEAGIQQMYDFPLCLVRNQVFRGYMAFPLPDDIRDFPLLSKIIMIIAPKGLIILWIFHRLHEKACFF